MGSGTDRPTAWEFLCPLFRPHSLLVELCPFRCSPIPGAKGDSWALPTSPSRIHLRRGSMSHFGHSRSTPRSPPSRVVQWRSAVRIPRTSASPARRARCARTMRPDCALRARPRSNDKHHKQNIAPGYETSNSARLWDHMLHARGHHGVVPPASSPTRPTAISVLRRRTTPGRQGTKVPRVGMGSRGGALAVP